VTPNPDTIEALATRRSVLRGAAGVGTATFAGCLGGGDADAGSDVVAAAPLPSDPESHTYPVMGVDGPAITYYGNWKCPVCAEFSTGSERVLALGTIVSDYIESDRLRLRYRSLSYRPNGEPFLGADAVRAARAGLAVWDTEPESFWPFYETVMANQPPESDTWATTDRLLEFAETAGVGSLEAVREALEDGRYQQAVRDSAEAARSAGISGTPQLVIDGSIYSPFKSTETRDALDTLAG
jgi:protein-disulfide isomerase